MDKITFPRSLYMEIMDTIGKVDAEAGGVIAIDGKFVCDYHFDEEAGVGKRFYVPSIREISDKVNSWLADSKSFGGFVHSHNAPYTKLSAMDILAAEKTLSLNQLKEMFMGIVCANELYLYKVILRENARSTVEQCAFEVM